jgi:hypothetical protein
MRLIYLSPLPWCSFTQRPHEFVSYFHEKTSGEVLWIDPYPTRLPSLMDFTRAKENKGDNFRAVPEWLTVVCPRALPIEPVPIICACNKLLWSSVIRQARVFSKKGKTTLAVGKPSALALDLLNSVNIETSLYDAMDNFPAFYSGISKYAMARHEQAIAQRVTRLLVSSSKLAEKFSLHSKKTFLVLNACRDDLPLPHFKASNIDHPVIGYIGTLGKWFDWEILISLARNYPNYRFRLIGPVFSESTNKLPSNVDLLPPLEHSAALEAMRGFDVGLIPFKRNSLTEAVDPIKYYEYRAMGLPVLSTAFGEMLVHGKEEGVFLLNEECNAKATFDEALQYHSKESSIMLFREQNSWKRRFFNAELFNPQSSTAFQ